MRTLVFLIALLVLQGCTTMLVGTAAGIVTTVAVETVKVPFKVTGAVIDVATGDNEDEEDDEDDEDDQG